jgi:hypothetical protein
VKVVCRDSISAKPINLTILARHREIVEVWVERYDASKTTIGAHPADLPRRRAGAADADELGGALSLIGAAAIVAGSAPPCGGRASFQLRS